MQETVKFSEELRNGLYEAWENEKREYAKHNGQIKPAADFESYLGECLAIYFHDFKAAEERRKSR